MHNNQPWYAVLQIYHAHGIHSNGYGIYLSLPYSIFGDCFSLSNRWRTVVSPTLWHFAAFIDKITVHFIGKIPRRGSTFALLFHTSVCKCAVIDLKRLAKTRITTLRSRWTLIKRLKIWKCRKTLLVRRIGLFVEICRIFIEGFSVFLENMSCINKLFLCSFAYSISCRNVIYFIDCTN